MSHALEKFAREYPGRSKLLHLRQRSPSAAVVRKVVQDFERTGSVISHSGVEADIAAQWCRRWGRCFIMAWHSQFGAWIVRNATAEDVEARV